MNPQSQPQNGPTADQLRQLLLDETLQRVRKNHSETVSAVLTDLAGWLAIDSWLGGGKSTGTEDPQDDGAYPAFRAVSTVLSMSAELAEAAVTMAARRRSYAVAAVIRQLIECEYLLTLFDQDLDHATTWIRSTPAEIRQTFSPAKMRKRTGNFSSEEYWKHCDAGGHPAPKGARLLEHFDPAREVWPLAFAELIVDLGLHLQRVWQAVDRVLSAHHVRYTTVRAEQRQTANDAWAVWRATDPLVATISTLGLSVRDT